MKKKQLFIASVMLLISFTLSITGTLQAGWIAIKLITLAYGICMASYALLAPHWHYHNDKIAMFAIAFLALFTIVIIDTLLIHALYWFPGIIKYPLISLYGAPYLVFILPGWLLCFLN